MFTVYVLYTDKHGLHYIGYTSDLAEHLRSHNHLATKGWAVRYRPWRVIYTEEYGTKSDALAREKWLKSALAVSPRDRIYKGR
jgi:putative endonuclease